MTNLIILLFCVWLIIVLVAFLRCLEVSMDPYIQQRKANQFFLMLIPPVAFVYVLYVIIRGLAEVFYDIYLDARGR